MARIRWKQSIQLQTKQKEIPNSNEHVNERLRLKVNATRKKQRNPPGESLAFNPLIYAKIKIKETRYDPREYW